MSKAAVWKSVQKIRQLGIDVISVHGRGYKLTQQMQWLQLDSIKPLLPTALQATMDSFNVTLSEQSSNDVLLKQEL